MPLVRRKPALRARGCTARLEARGTAARRAAALALAGDARAVPALLASLEREPAREVRAAIATALIRSGTEDAARGLAALLGSDDAALRNEAAEALRCLGDVAARPVAALLDHPDRGCRLMAIGVLEGFRDAWARQRLSAVLQRDPEVTVGLAAVEVLRQVGEPSDAAALHAFAARFPGEPMVGFAVGLALRQLGAEAAR